MPIIDVYGPPRERGRKIGESLREQISTLSQKHEHAIRDGRGYDLDEYFASFDAFGQYQDAIDKWAPDLLEEVKGLAEGADIPIEKALRLQLLDEDWFFDTYHYRPEARILSKCTSFGVVDGQGERTFAGQNMDIMSYTDGHQVLLRIHSHDSDHVSLVFTYAGLIGLVGLNSASIGVNCNTLMQLGCNPTGLPVAYVVRRILDSGSFDQALGALQEVNHASGQNYLLSSPGRIGSYECSPSSVQEYRPRTDGLRVCHTNHPLANDDQDQFKRLAQECPTNSWVKGENSHARFASVAARTLNNGSTLGLEELKSALSAKDDPNNPVSREHSTVSGNSSIAFTAGALIYEFAGAPKLHVAAGPPTESEFMTYSVTRES